MNAFRLFSAFALAFLTLLATGVRAQTPSAAPAAAATAPNTVVYVGQLPQPAQLVSAAEAQGMKVDRIDQSATQVTAIYRQANGQTVTITYLPLPDSETGAGAAAPGSTVVYGSPAPAYYYPYGYYPYAYYPWGWYPPIAVGFRFGFGHRWR